MEKSIVMLRAKEVQKILEGKEEKILEIVKETYLAHDQGMTSLPYSTFLRFSENGQNRMISLPAYLGGEHPIVGMKWIASFPDNITKNGERASAVMILNDIESGRVKGILEGSIISAKRTAASGVLAAKYLHDRMDEERMGMIGCGRINSEMLLFFTSVFKNIKKIYLYDNNLERAIKFSQTSLYQQIEFICCQSIEDLFDHTTLVSVATTAGVPFIDHIPKKMTVLDISLRDFTPDVLNNAHNIVDDADHICREKTSIELTYQQKDSKNFISGTLAEVIHQKVDAREQGKPTIFSPFGLGILDLAVADYVYKQAQKSKMGCKIADFLP